MPWPDHPELVAPQTRARTQYQMRQLLDKILVSVHRDMIKDVLSWFDPAIFEYADDASKDVAQEIWSDERRLGAPKALDTLCGLGKDIMMHRGLYDGRYNDIKIRYKSRTEDSQSSHEPLIRHARRLVAPFYPVIFPEYNTRLDVLSSENFFGEDLRTHTFMMHDLSRRLERMIRDAPYLLGLKHFIILVRIVVGPDRLRDVLEESQIAYSVDDLDGKIAGWLRMYCGGRGVGSSQHKVTVAFDELQTHFGMLRSAHGNVDGFLQ